MTTRMKALGSFALAAIARPGRLSGRQAGRGRHHRLDGQSQPEGRPGPGQDGGSPALDLRRHHRGGGILHRPGDGRPHPLEVQALPERGPERLRQHHGHGHCPTAPDRPEIFAGYHFLVLDTDEVNAMAAPGGFIFVTKGLVKRCGDEETMAAILAHEIGHVAERHGLQSIKKSRLIDAFKVIGSEASQTARLRSAYETHRSLRGRPRRRRRDPGRAGLRPEIRI